jgi:hypothetical protein
VALLTVAAGAAMVLAAAAMQAMVAAGLAAAIVLAVVLLTAAAAAMVLAAAAVAVCAPFSRHWHGCQGCVGPATQLACGSGQNVHCQHVGMIHSQHPYHATYPAC